MKMDQSELRVKLDEILQCLRSLEIKLELYGHGGSTIGLSQLSERRRVSLENYKRAYSRQNGVPNEVALQDGEENGYDEVD